ncbi:MAG: helix-turn-helix transcriptional regulator [Anaeromyxobacteraceae bacterium]
MQQMTQEENPSKPAVLDARRARHIERKQVLQTWGPAALFAFIAAAIGGDLASDVFAGASGGHLVAESFVMGLSLLGLSAMYTQLRTERARARDLQRDLDGTRADLARWRDEAQEHLRGLGAAIDTQFRRWELTPAEREVALLLLKGLSLKDIADLRATSERTVRQQSLGIYRKSGVAGRAELAAFFLEDLLLPSETARGAG